MKLARVLKFTGVLLLSSLLLVAGVSADLPLGFLNFPGLLIVLGGTLTAMLLSFSYQELLSAFKQLQVLVKPLNRDFSKETKQVQYFATLWFRKQETLIDLELERLDNAFLKKGLQMVRDQESAEDVLAHLNWQISQERARQTEVINLYRAMANYAPVFGLIGALFGLVNMLNTIGLGDLSSVASDMGLALVAVLYGLLLANLVFKPVVSKLEQRRHLSVTQLSLMAEGIGMIQQRRTPSVIRATLMAFMLDPELSERETIRQFNVESLMSKLST